MKQFHFRLQVATTTESATLQQWQCLYASNVVVCRNMGVTVELSFIPVQLHSLLQVATGTPCHLPLRRRAIIIAILRGFGKLYGPFCSRILQIS